MQHGITTHLGDVLRHGFEVELGAEESLSITPDTPVIIVVIIMS